jgi:hypothetical protein
MVEKPDVMTECNSASVAYGSKGAMSNGASDYIYVCICIYIHIHIHIHILIHIHMYIYINM